MPQLSVIAAGSLLDFALAEHEFSMPVGRISYVYLEPLSFEEFLSAIGKQELRTYIKNYDWNLDIPEAIHLQLIKFIKEYLIVGGMPSAVLSWKTQNVPHLINQIHFDLLATYRDDFVKYRGRLSLHQLASISEISIINNGGMAEQLVGQILRTVVPPYMPPSLYYWQREKKDSTAEVDYIIQHENQIIPVEVKAGKTGSLKSLREFIIEKNKTIGIRINSDQPSRCRVQTNDPAGISIKYQLLSLPFYLLGQIHRLINHAEEQPLTDLEVN